MFMRIFAHLSINPTSNRAQYSNKTLSFFTFAALNQSPGIFSRVHLLTKRPLPYAGIAAC